MHMVGFVLSINLVFQEFWEIIYGFHFLMFPLMKTTKKDKN